MLLTVANGAQAVLHIRFDPDRVLADIARKKITVFPAVPTMYTALVNHPKVKEFDLSSVAMWSSGGAPLPMEVLQRFEGLTGHSPREGYGLTETAPLGTLQITDGPARQGSVGLPAPHTILEVVDVETGTKVLPVGERGEICFRGPQIMKGYWKKPEATEEAFRGGRFHTGDIGFLDQDGFVTLVDRKKDMILSGGFNVFPRNIEEAIYEHPGVAEVTVIGIPDAYRGQSAKAFIALKPGQRAVRHRRAQGVPRRQARQIRDADRDGNPRQPAEDAGRQALEERACRRGDGQEAGGRSAAAGRPQGRLSATLSRVIRTAALARPSKP